MPTKFDPNDVEILIVEDSRTQAIGLKFLLSEHGFNVRVAYDGQLALDALAEYHPTLIISDIMMPNMDGYELCRYIKNDDALKDIPIILLTALSDLHDVIRAIESGANNFVTKPYKPDFLLSRIHHILVNQQLRKGKVNDQELEVFFDNTKYVFSTQPGQVIDLLLSTFENAVQKNKELQDSNEKLLATQRELKSKNAELEKVNAQKDQFLGMAAHDLRNPLGHIATVAEILMEDLADEITEQQMQLLGITQTSSKFMLDLVNDLLDISKIESGKLDLRLEAVDLVSLIRNNVDKNRSLADNKDIALVQNLTDEPLMTTVDVNKIEQVLNNLISNAVKFSYPETTITINLSEESGTAHLSVSDEGQGIPEDELDKLFQPFERTSVTSTAGEKSTGLGLVIVRKIIEGHQGKIWLESVVGEGTTFHIRLPLTT